MPNSTEYGKALRAAVKKLDLKYPVKEVSEKTKHSKGNVSEYLNKKKEPSESFFLSFCTAFGLNADDVLEESKEVLEHSKDSGEDIRQRKAFEPRTQRGLVAVPVGAQAGYSKYYMDPVFVNDLERMLLPGNPYEGDQFRCFQIDGDSMEYYKDGELQGLRDGMWIIAQSIEPEGWKEFDNFHVHVIVLEGQIFIKRLLRYNDKYFIIHSDNKRYHQKPIAFRDVKEMWMFKRKLDWNAAPPERIEIDPDLVVPEE